MESNIPQEIEDKIDEVYGLESEGAPQWCAAVYGYSLALPEISALRDEVERLRGTLNAFERIERICLKDKSDDEDETAADFSRIWDICQHELKTLNNL